MKNRILITTNLYGRLDEFKALLTDAAYNPKNDILITLGNYLNYGPKQIELINYLMELEKEGAIILFGEMEQKYIDALINSDFKAEQYITKNKNVFYDYLDNKQLRDSHFEWFITLKENYVFKNYCFSSNNKILANYTNYFNDKNCVGDFEENGNVVGLSFKNCVGLMDITNRKVYKIDIL